MTKLFILGITGYIGGTTAALLVEKHPEYEITALVRNEEQAEKVKDALPNVKTVLGDLESSDIIKEESAKADIVFNSSSSDHVKSVQSILDGLGSQEKKTYFIHTTGVFHFFSSEYQFDSPTEKVWNDVEGLDELINLPVIQMHGPEDKMVWSRGGYKNVNIAMVDPPCVYGKGLGPIKQRGTLLPLLVKASLLNGKAIKVGEGAPTWSAVHVELLGEIFVWLFEQASTGGGGSADWNEKGWYLAENDSYNWSDLADSLGKIGHASGYFSSPEVESVSIDSAKSILEEAGDKFYASMVPYCIGAGIKIRSERLRSHGFEAEKPSVVSTLEEVLNIEADLLGIEKK